MATIVGVNTNSSRFGTPTIYDTHFRLRANEYKMVPQHRTIYTARGYRGLVGRWSVPGAVHATVSTPRGYQGDLPFQLFPQYQKPKPYERRGKW